MSNAALAENVVQSACMDALAVYFREQGVTYRQLWTYANQQGEGENQFCGDLIGVIDSASLLLMEFKSLDHEKIRLNEFRQDQYEVALAMEEDVRIAYCYDYDDPLAYYEDEPRRRSWPEDTLKGMKASLPSTLPGEYPDTASHGSLLDWIDELRGVRPTNLIQLFGKLVGPMLPNMARNSLLTMVFSKERKEAYGLGKKGLRAFNDWLIRQRFTDPVLAQRVRELRAAINDQASASPQKTKKVGPKQ